LPTAVHQVYVGRTRSQFLPFSPVVNRTLNSKSNELSGNPCPCLLKYYLKIISNPDPMESSTPGMPLSSNIAMCRSLSPIFNIPSAAKS